MKSLSTDETPLLKRLNGIEAVLFDIYGTLLISGTGDISIATEKQNIFSIDSLLKKQGIEILHDHINQLFQETYHHCIKSSHEKSKNAGVDFPEVEIRDIWREILKTMADQQWISLPLEDQYSLECLSLEYELMSNPVWPMENTKEILHYLKDTGMELGIVSNAQFYTPLTLETLLGAPLKDWGFQEELQSWSYQLGRAKPSKDLFKGPMEALAKKGLPPAKILYVGNDMLNDIYTAEQWGCKTALFAGDKRSLRRREGDSRCIGIEPDLILTDLSQLKECLHG